VRKGLRTAALSAGAAAVAWVLGALAVHAGTLPAYHTIQVPLPGDEGWDYLTYDAASERLFIAHGVRVLVVDARTLKVAGEIPDTPGAHGIALAPDLGRGFVSAGRANLLVVFDLKTLARLGEIATTGANPDAVLYDPFTQRVFSFNGRGRSVTAIDAKTQQVAGTVALDAKPESGVSDAAGHLYVNLEDKSSIAQLDARTLKVTAVWPVSGCHEPTGLAIDTREHWLTTVCGNHVLSVLDARSGRVLGSAVIGAGVDGVAMDHHVALASCGEGVLSLVRLNERGIPELAENIPTQRGARTLALDAAKRRVFLVTADFAPAPASSAEQPHPRPGQLRGTFRLLVVQLPTSRSAP
jgi:DNA-binding beta-propeller fold protein YncE